MNRCTFVLLFTLGLTVSSISSSAYSQTTRPSGRKPNVIIILADDLGYADLGCQQISKDVKTPKIDSLAAAGVRFTSGYVSCPVCSPTRAGLITGRYQQRFGFEKNPYGNSDEDVFGLPLDQITLPQQLKTNGYVTGMVGKWHLGHGQGMLPTQRGFDEFFGFTGGAHKYLDNEHPQSDTNAIRRGESPVGEKEYLTDAFTREAVSFIERHKDQPFFLYLPYNAVHSPLQVTQTYLARFPGEQNEKRRTTLAMLSALDDGVGAVMAKLREHHLEDDTLVIFLSDNGGATDDDADSRNTPLRGTKGTAFEGGIRVPFIIQWTGHIQPRVEERMIIQLDLFPTILAATGTASPTNVDLDGVNLLPWLIQENPQPIHDALYWRFGGRRAVRSGNWKLQWEGSETPHLYDLSKDIAESNDSAAMYPKITRSLMQKWKRWNAELMQPRWKGRP